MKKSAKYIITLVIGLLISLVSVLGLGIFRHSETHLIMKDLSNGFLTAAVLIGGVGLLTVINAGGNFDMMSYSFKKFVRLFRFRPNEFERKGPDFYEYRKAKDAKRKPLWFLVIVGAFYFLVSFVFVLLFYKYYLP
jgi:hypothetical protein